MLKKKWEGWLSSTWLQTTVWESEVRVNMAAKESGKDRFKSKWLHTKKWEIRAQINMAANDSGNLGSDQHC
jgi:hypothetical protein